MNKKELLFYDDYEAFYTMTKESNAFQSFCKDAFGEDFSQDGFSNKEQIDMILKYIPQNDDVHILDIGCGNGKMLGYLQERTRAHIYGFDYSKTAITTAKALFCKNAEFREGIIGEIEYPKEKFDVIISMDTLYFATDMTAFVAQTRNWLKKMVCFLLVTKKVMLYRKTSNAHTTMLVKALQENNMTYEVTDITKQTYELLKKKRESAIKYRTLFEDEDYSQWFDMLIGQTEYSNVPFEQFKEKWQDTFMLLGTDYGDIMEYMPENEK